MCDHPFSWRSKTTKRALRVEVGGGGEGEGGWTKFEKGTFKNPLPTIYILCTCEATGLKVCMTLH